MIYRVDFIYYMYHMYFRIYIYNFMHVCNAFS